MASTSPIDRYVLEGRFVTMGPAGVIDDGAIFVDGGVIEAVQPAEDPIPDRKYDGATHIRTGDTIYPGLIELHNHLSYNAIPLWDVPQKFSNNGQWRGSEGYSRDITKPSQVLGNTPGVAQALVRYAECRALLGGVTTSQGITLAKAGTIQKYYKGIVRNVEAPEHPDLPRAETKIANPPTTGAQKYLDTNLTVNSCYLQHLSEGTDDTARGWFLRLRIDDATWAINDVLCGIHSAALRAEDFEILAAHGASMVWSPLSNYLLYGETADIGAAKAAGVSLSLGSDWAPSGSKNLLGELKVAWLASEAAGAVFTPEELVAMVTVNPARAAKWDHLVGSIQPGMLADLIAINGRNEDPFEQLVFARETSLTLALIEGVPRVGQTTLMRRFWPNRPLDEVVGIDRYKLGRSTRYLYLAHDDDLLEGLTLSQAEVDLAAAMQNLPQLAADVDSAVGSALTADGAVAFAGGIADTSGDEWRVVPDFEDDDLELAAAAGDLFSAAQPYSFWVTEPIALDPITVTQDRNHLRTLVRAPNLPEHIRRGLPGTYGQRIAIPDSVGFLESTDERVADQLRTTTGTLSDLRRTFGELRLEDRRLIVDEALLVLEGNYVHLPLKRAMYAIDPLQQLRLLRHRLDDMAPDEMPREIEFHAEMMTIFNSLRDLHTGYRLPRPFSTKVAWLPFLIEEVAAGGGSEYILTKWVAGAWPDPRMREAIVTHWNGVPIATAVARNADLQAGGNADARHARGINSLTIRPLARSLPPDEDWVTLRWLDAGGTAHDHVQEWVVFEPGAAIGPTELLMEASAMGLDDHTDDVQQAKKILFAPKVAEAERMSEGQRVQRAIRDDASDLASFMPGVFRAMRVKRSDAGARSPEFGYLRIFTFNVPDAAAFVDEFVRLIDRLPRNGLIIDVRGNGGGLIHAAEQLLDVLTPHSIEPERAQFINTPVNLGICRRHAPSEALPGLDLGAWVDSIRMAVRTGATYSLGFPITAPRDLSRLGQRYHGPVALITDPLCYSATDMFAAGFQDHEIGTIVGAGGSTGAGGANVWTHGLLRRLTTSDDGQPSPYTPLPHGADIRVAVRRTTRVKGRSGAVLEDLGVEPEIPYRMTRRDVTGHNEDLIDRVIDELATERVHAIDVTRLQRHRDRAPTLRVSVENVDRIESTVDGRSLVSRRVRAGKATIELDEAVAPGATGSVSIRMLGYEGPDLVAERREVIDLG